MLPSGVRAEEIDSKGSGEPKVEDAQGEGQNKAEDKKEAEDTDKKVSDAVKEENKEDVYKRQLPFIPQHLHHPPFPQNSIKRHPPMTLPHAWRLRRVSRWI